MKFRLRSAHRGLTGCGLRHGPIGRLPCRAVPCRAVPCRAGPGRARRPGAPAARVADARPRFGALGNGRSAHRPEWPEDVRAPAGRRAVARCSGDAGSSAGFQPGSASNSLEFAGNPPRIRPERRASAACPGCAPRSNADWSGAIPSCASESAHVHSSRQCIAQPPTIPREARPAKLAAAFRPPPRGPPNRRAISPSAARSAPVRCPASLDLRPPEQCVRLAS